ncbi:MAG: PAS domain S-box protein [Ferruginibacter sp.]
MAIISWLEGSFTNLLHDPAVGAIVANVRDVTERKELEDLLHKANTLARIGSWEVDLEKGTVYWTDITRDIHEVEVDYIPNLETGINFYKQGKGRDLIKQKVNEAIEAGKPWDVELQIITAKNNERWIRSIGQTEFKHGKCIRIFGSFQDIDMRKKAEEKLIASELQFRSTLDNMLEGAQIIGFDWRYIYINDSLARHAKYNRDEMIGYTVMEKFPGIEQTAIYNVYQRCFNERVSIHLENEFHFPDGSTGWFELSFQPVPEGIFILSIDITERKKAEQAILSAEANYREIFEKASDAIYVHEIDTGKVIEVNQRATEITGYTKEEIITGNPQDMLTDNPLYSMEYAFDYLQKAAAGMPQLFDWLSKNKDGSHNWLEVNLKKANIAGEERILAFFREINDRKKAQLEVQKLNEELEQKVIIRTEQLRKTNEELEAFSYSVSHDLRAPLRAIIGFSAILQEEYINKLDDEAKRITGIIINNTKKMGQLIDDLLSFSRLGRQPIVKTTVHTNVMIEDIIAEMDFKNSNKQPDWSIATLPDIKADTNAIRQVWVNLISNAVKYSNKNNNPVIEIGSRQEKNETVFFIKDNGVGFDTKYKDKLFKVFQRLHSAAEFEGTGVGLAIVEKIITRHGGRVWAEAIINNGACFYFSLPNE